MGNCEAQYRYALKTAAQTAALCRDLQNKRAPSKDAVRRDRLQEIAVRRALTEELYEAFITRIDREDLFAVYEELADTLYTLQGIAVRGGNCSAAVWSTVCGVADALYEAVEAFADGKMSPLLRAAAQVYGRVAEAERYASADEYAVIGEWLRCCRRAARQMTAALLKNV